MSETAQNRCIGDYVDFRGNGVEPPSIKEAKIPIPVGVESGGFREDMGIMIYSGLRQLRIFKEVQD